MKRFLIISILLLISSLIFIPFITNGQFADPNQLANCTASTVPGIWIKNKDNPSVRPETFAIQDYLAVEKVIVEVDFPFPSSRSCPGYARVLYVWKNSVNQIAINQKTEFNLFSSKPAPREYQVKLQLAFDQAFKNIYFEKSSAVTVVTRNAGTGTGTSNGNGNVNSGASGGIGITNSPPNSAINTNTSYNFNGSLDDTIGTFFNPLKRQNGSGADTVPEIIGALIRILFVLIGLISVIIIIIAGFRMVTASGNEEQLTKAKKAITWAIVGLIVSLLSFSIVAIIQALIAKQ
jgi:hypothetical protein